MSRSRLQAADTALDQTRQVTPVAPTAAGDSKRVVAGAVAVDGTGASPVGHASDWHRREIGLAIRNAVKLGGALTITWGIALLVRLYVPRFLGPERFGMLSFAEAFAATAFVLLSLGLDPYVRKEISVRPEHASDFAGGVLALRIVLALVVFGGMQAFLVITERPAEVRQLAYIYAAGQFFFIGNATTAGMLHAKGSVTEMSIYSVLVKVVWGLAIVGAIVFRLDLWAFAAAYLLSEGLKSAVLFGLTRRHLGLRLRFDGRALRNVLIACVPFYIANVSTVVYNRIDMSILAVLADNREVGMYGAAASLAGLTLLLTPLISWVLMPLFARARAESEAELTALVRRSLELILALAIPVALLMAAGADVWIGIIFGEAFAAAAQALRVLAVAFLVMYVSIVCWCALTMLDRQWAMTAIFAGGLVVNPLVNLLLIPVALRRLGEGGGGAACAVATLITEIGVVAPMLVLLGRRTLDRRLATMLVKCTGAAVVVYAMDLWLRNHLGPERLVLVAVSYAALIVVTRAVNFREMAAWGKLAMERRKS